MKCGAKIPKPIHKRWYVWVISIFILAGIGGAFNSTEPEVVGTNADTNTEQPTTQEFKVGDVIKTGNFNIVVNSVNFSQGDTFMTPDAGNQYCLIDITLENISNDTQTVSSMIMFEARDGEGREMPMSLWSGGKSLIGGTLFAGKKMSGAYAVETPKDVAGLELLFNDSVFGDPISIKLQ